MRTFGAFPIFDNFVSGKLLVVEKNVLKFEQGWRQVFSVYMVILTVKCLRFPIFDIGPGKQSVPAPGSLVIS